MGFSRNIRWIKGLIFGIGGPTGINLKDNAGALDLRDAADAAFINARVLTPVISDDAATKGYVDAQISSSMHEIRFPIALATVSSTATIPANAIIGDRFVEITTAYSVGATIQVGTVGTPALLQGTGDNDPQCTTEPAPSSFAKREEVSWGGVTQVVRVTIAGGPVAGAGFVAVRYSIPSV